MTLLNNRLRLSPAEASQLAKPRTDLLIEEEVSSGVFAQEKGPFENYERRIQRNEVSDGTIEVTEEIEYTLAVPLWGPAVNLLMRKALKSTDRSPRARWWWPREVVTSTTTRIIALLAVIAILGGYLGTLIGQTITFAAEQFGASDTAQANTLAATRAGIFFSLILIWRADRIGRKPLLIGFTCGAILFTFAGAFAPSLVVLGITQGVARGLTTGLLTLITVSATEEIPATMRAFILSLITLCGGLGGGMVLWILPISDLDPGGWRVAYALPVIFLPVLWWIHTTMPETRRFNAADEKRAPAKVDLRRFAMLASTVFFLAIFASPASQLQNEYLRDDLDFAAGQISLFRLIINLPIGVFVVGAGYLADRKGRKVLGTLGIGLGSIFSVLFFLSSGLWLFVVGAAGTWLFASAFPALRGYQTELFPTRSRARVGGWLDLAGVSGSVVGLLIAGQLIQSTGSIGSAIPWLAPCVLIAVLIIAVLFPETARAELEDFNPTDPEIEHPGLD